jgi:transposase-like protein
MAAIRKQYTREFKHEAVRLVTEQGSAWPRRLGIWGSMTTCSLVGRRNSLSRGSRRFLDPGRLSRTS